MNNKGKEERGDDSVVEKKKKKKGLGVLPRRNFCLVFSQFFFFYCSPVNFDYFQAFFGKEQKQAKILGTQADLHKFWESHFLSSSWLASISIIPSKINLWLLAFKDQCCTVVE